MDKHIVYGKDLTKADALILKNLHADILDVAAKAQSDGGVTNGMRRRSEHRVGQARFVD